jgi:hypothetical protein
MYSAAKTGYSFSRGWNFYQPQPQHAFRLDLLAGF